MVASREILSDFYLPQRDLANSVLLEAVKIIKNCPRTVNFETWSDTYGAKTRLINALEVLEDAVDQPERFIFWCEIAEIDVHLVSDKMIALAEKKPLLMKAWEAQNA